jgi:hypothetical protein
VRVMVRSSRTLTGIAELTSTRTGIIQSNHVFEQVFAMLPG